MTTAEKKELIANFIETYNPYGMRDYLKQKKQTTVLATNTQSTISPQWVSDGNSDKLDGQQIATHQLITLEAFNSFVTHFGFFQTNGATALAIALNLAAASGLPDIWEVDAFTFAGHFYNPDTGENWMHVSWPTAKSRAQAHYDDAIHAFNEDDASQLLDLSEDALTETLEELGKAMHYIQDVCEPHHATNQTALNSTHSDFEKYVERNIDELMPGLVTMQSDFFESIKNQSVGELTHDAAEIGKIYISMTTEELEEEWDVVGAACLLNAIHFSAGFLFLFFSETDASFLTEVG